MTSLVPLFALFEIFSEISALASRISWRIKTLTWLFKSRNNPRIEPPPIFVVSIFPEPFGHPQTPSLSAPVPRQIRIGKVHFELGENPRFLSLLSSLERRKDGPMIGGDAPTGQRQHKRL